MLQNSPKSHTNIISFAPPLSTIEVSGASRQDQGGPDWKSMRSCPNFIAIVDDDPLMRNGIRRLLQARDFQTKIFESAEQFLASGDLKAASCLVVDIGLTGMSGIELKRQMTREGQATPFIFVTALDDAAVHAAAHQVGCVTLLLKPFRAVELLSAVNKALS